MDTALTKYFSDEEWIINEKAGFMSDKSLRKSNFYLRRCVEIAESKLRKAKVHATSGKVISDQAFGFWTAFFEPHHYKLMHGQPIHVFNDKPATENRASIYRKLEMIRAFRNRVNHCEPLCFNAHDIDCSQAQDVRIKLFNLIEWIDPGLIPFFASMDDVQDRIDQIRSI